MFRRKKKTKAEGGEEKKKWGSLFSLIDIDFRRKPSAPTEEAQTSSQQRTSHDPVEPGGGRSSGSEAESDPEELGRAVMEALVLVLRGGTSGPPEQNPGGLLEAWGQKNPVPAPGQGSRAGRSPHRYPQPWLREFHQRVQESVEMHFPPLPAEVSAEQQPPQPSAYLRHIQEVLQRELLRLAPVLKEAGLLGAVIDRYHTHTVSQLELLLQKNLDMDQMFTLLEWTLHTYMSGSMLGHPELAADVQGAADLLLLTEWIQKAKNTLLNVTQEYVAGCLQRILKMEEEEAESRNYGNEEDFISLPRDITQCLWFVAWRAETVSRSLLGEIQRINFSELQAFLRKFTDLERRRIGGGEGRVLHLFRTISSCRGLRLLAEQLASEAQTDAASPAAVNLLKELEEQATKQLLHTATHNAEVCLRSYFRGHTHLQKLLSEIKIQFKNLPTECDTHKVVMDAVYSRIVSLYLEQLLLSNRTHLEKRWGEVGVAIREDADEMQKVFSQQNGSVEQNNKLLLKAAEIVSCEDVDIIYLEISTDCPDISKKQLKKLLRWGGRLSRQQLKAVMDM